MKRVQVIICCALLAGATAVAQKPNQQSQPPAQGTTGAQTGAPGAQTGAPGTQAGAQGAQQQPGAAPPSAKPMPQAKSQEEFQAYNEAAQKADPAQAEAAADAFAAKYKDSEIRTVLYHRVMQQYQQANNADDAVKVGRKILAIDPRDPIANVMVATILSERTRDTDLDKDQRLAEAEGDAKKSLETLDTDFMYPPGTPQEAVDRSKGMVRSMAYAALGQSAAVRENYPAAENYFKQAVSVAGAQPDAITWLQYSLVLDKQKKYQDALVTANKAFNAAPAGSPVQNLVKQERDRLLKLTGAGAPATGSAPPATGAAPSATAPKTQNAPPPKQ